MGASTSERRVEFRREQRRGLDEQPDSQRPRRHPDRAEGEHPAEEPDELEATRDVRGPPGEPGTDGHVGEDRDHDPPDDRTQHHLGGRPTATWETAGPPDRTLGPMVTAALASRGPTSGRRAPAGPATTGTRR